MTVRRHDEPVLRLVAVPAPVLVARYGYVHHSLREERRQQQAVLETMHEKTLVRFAEAELRECEAQRLVCGLVVYLK